MSLPADADADLVAAHARRARQLVPEMVAEIVAAIAARVPRYAVPPTAKTNPVEDVTTRVLHRCLDALDGAPHRDRGVDDRFREVGRREARAGRSLVDFHAALAVGIRVGWRRFEAMSRDPDTVVGLLSILLAYTEHLTEQAEAGHAEARRLRAADPRHARALLAEQLLTTGVAGNDAESSEEVWEVPASATVAVAELDRERPDRADLTRRALVLGLGDRVVVLSDADERDEVTRTLVDAGVRRVACSWPVEPGDLPSAFRWVRRVLDLVHRGVIADAPVIDIGEHRTELWLHSEPVLRQQLSQEVLSPLMAETPNSREILSETLLVWLETRDSAPAIAARLGVHPQTVRYRWKRINELFGEDLHDPEFIVQITMLLKATVPLWKAGDQSDFERYRSEEST